MRGRHHGQGLGVVEGDEGVDAHQDAARQAGLVGEQRVDQPLVVVHPARVPVLQPSSRFAGRAEQELGLALVAEVVLFRREHVAHLLRLALRLAEQLVQHRVHGV